MYSETDSINNFKNNEIFTKVALHIMYIKVQYPSLPLITHVEFYIFDNYF